MSEERAARFGRYHWMGLAFGLVVFVGLIASPPLAGLPRPAQNLAGVTVLMAALWITQALPIAVTSLLPLVAFPILGIEEAKSVSKAYIDQNIFLFLGGFIIALGIEKWGLHQRMALHIVRILGTSPKRMVLGFMLATAFLSMWISNTASTLLMLPIGLALMSSLSKLPLETESLTPGEIGSLEAGRESSLRHFMTVLLLGIAYSASIGGFTTLVGTPTNVQFIGIWDRMFVEPESSPPAKANGEEAKRDQEPDTISKPPVQPPAAPRFSAGQWMLAVAPLGVCYLLLAWGGLTWKLPRIPGSEKLDRGFFTDRLKQLGPPDRAECSMLVVFIVTAMLWIFRKPLTFGETTLLPGWQDFVEETIGAVGMHDSTVAMGMAILLFLIPAGRTENGQAEFLMDWKTAERLPWGILLLIGGGFALAQAFSSTGLSEFLGREFSQIVANWPAWLLVAATCFLLTFLTELTSNVATVATLVPVLAQTAIEIGLDPRVVMIPATIAASCAFMLPIATPPNAIVFGSGRIEMWQMVRYGIGLNLLGVVLITLAMFLLLVPQLGISLDTIPEWAKLAGP